MYSWGSTADGMIGCAGVSSTSTKRVGRLSVERPTLVESLLGRTIVQVAAGQRHVLALDTAGQVYAWGFGGYGRLGHKDSRDRPMPEVIKSLLHIPIRQVDMVFGFTDSFVM